MKNYNRHAPYQILKIQWSFTKMGGNFSEFRESDKLLKYELGSIWPVSCWSHLSFLRTTFAGSNSHFTKKILTEFSEFCENIKGKMYHRLAPELDLLSAQIYF